MEISISYEKPEKELDGGVGIPDLIVLEVLEGDFVEPFQFLEQVALDSENDGGAVEPDSIMSRIHLNDIRCKAEDPLRLFIVCHDGSKVGHGFAVLFCVGNSCKRVWASVVLGNGNDVFPLFGVGVFTHLAAKYQNAMSSDEVNRGKSMNLCLNSEASNASMPAPDLRDNG